MYYWAAHVRLFGLPLKGLTRRLDRGHHTYYNFHAVRNVFRDTRIAVGYIRHQAFCKLSCLRLQFATGRKDVLDTLSRPEIPKARIFPLASQDRMRQ
jgi:hypothetical protein